MYIYINTHVYSTRCPMLHLIYTIRIVLHLCTLIGRRYEGRTTLIKRKDVLWRMTRVEEIVDCAGGYVAERQSAYAYPIVPPPPKSRGQPTAWGPPPLLLYTLFYKEYIYVSSLYYILKPLLIILLPQSREFDIFSIEKNKLELNLLLLLLLTFDRNCFYFLFFRRKENGTLRKDCNREK